MNPISVIDWHQFTEAYPTCDPYLVLQIAKETVHKRFQSPQIFKNDMLGSFLKHGLTRSQAENEISVTLYDSVHLH